AYAQQAGAAAPTGGGTGPFVMMAVIFAIFYFLVIRPQQKQQKKLKHMLSEAKRGDEIVTTGGMHGRIVDIVENNLVMIQVANNVIIKMERGAIQHIKGYDIKELEKKNEKDANKDKKVA
ncbi:MAG TPA: preprotein translocase subunit YajC, partial [bacterium]|nr:preprotein translocase subunit YajC [bacterium]